MTYISIQDYNLLNTIIFFENYHQTATASLLHTCLLLNNIDSILYLIQINFNFLFNFVAQFAFISTYFIIKKQ
jgi:hypothetical protein